MLVLLFASNCMCLVQDMINTLDDCGLLEKVVNVTNVRERNDVTVLMKGTTIQISFTMQNMYIIIVFVFYVDAMAISVIVNQAEYQ